MSDIKINDIIEVSFCAYKVIGVGDNTAIVQNQRGDLKTIFLTDDINILEDGKGHVA